MDVNKSRICVLGEKRKRFVVYKITLSLSQSADVIPTSSGGIMFNITQACMNY